MIAHSKPLISSEDHEAVRAQLASLELTQGRAAVAFEQELETFSGAPAVVTSSGTAALLLILQHAQITPGDDVLLPGYICESVDHAIRAVGATPVFYDNADRWLASTASVTAHWTDKTRALLLLHPLGFVLPAAPFRELAQSRGAVLIEDYCHAFGAPKTAFASAPGLGAANTGYAFTSFHATKLLTTGEGGAVFASTAEAAAMRNRRDGDEDLKARVVAPMSDLNAALGRAQLARFPAMLQRRKAIAEFYLDELRELPLLLPQDLAFRTNWFRFPLLDPALWLPQITNLSERLQEANRGFLQLRARFAEHGVAVRRGVDALLGAAESLPVAAQTLATTLSIPLYPALTDAEVESVVAATKAVYRRSQ
jgi:dTDP-4-amino-4,6-dideoxygalactose transaminase